MNLTTFHQRILSVLLIALSFLCALQTRAQEEQSGVAMKMTEHLNELLEQGAATMNAMRRTVDARPVATAATPALAPTRLKMDKINSRYLEQQDEIIDRRYKLAWARCSLGQHWDHVNKRCAGTVRQYTYDQAVSRANERWRLPTAAELATLIDRTKKNSPEVLAVDSVAFPDMDMDKLIYWSSEEENNSFAWAVLFVDTGIPAILYRSHRYAVRLVRNAN